MALCLCGLFVLAAISTRAIELSLEENRAERGSVGYVDMQRLFKASPDATRAREGLEELVRQAEERVNAKKAEMLRVRQELEALKLEREELAKSTPTVSVPVPVPAPASAVAVPKAAEAPKPAAKPVPAADPAPVTALPPTARPHRGAIPLPATPAPTPETSTISAPSPAPLMINLPGLTDGPLNLERPGASPLNPTRAKKEPEVQAPVPVPVEQIVVSTPAETTAAVAVIASTPAASAPAGPTLAQRLLEFDGRIIAKQGDLDRLQADLDRERLGAERTLLDAEGRKTDQVLARLYRAISEVAKREGVSVVVDKSATLYGHSAVDLTDKILKQLRGVIPASQ